MTTEDFSEMRAKADALSSICTSIRKTISYLDDYVHRFGGISTAIQEQRCKSFLTLGKELKAVLFEAEEIRSDVSGWLLRQLPQGPDDHQTAWCKK